METDVEEFYLGEYYNTGDIDIRTIRKSSTNPTLSRYGIKNLIENALYISCFEESGDCVTFAYSRDAKALFKMLNEARIEDIKEQMEELQEKFDKAMNATYEEREF